MTPSYPTASLTRSQGMVFHRFSGDPVTRSKRTHPWMSGVTMLVRWLCSSPASERHVKWVCPPSFFPGLRKCTPRQKKSGYVNQQAAPFQRPPKKACPGGLAVTGFGKECTLTPSRRSESERELLDLHFHRGPRPEFQDTVGKTCRTSKKQRQRQATNPEENRQRDNLQITKLGDDQERRPFPKWRKTKGRELLASTKKKRSG